MIAERGAWPLKLALTQATPARTFLDWLLAALVFAAFAIWPVYFFPPGYPQPVTLAIVLAFALTVLRHPQSLAATLQGGPLTLIGAFITYAVAVNLIYAAVYQRLEPLLHVLFYLQVLLACIVMRSFLDREPAAARIVYLGVVASLAAQLLVILIHGPAATLRETALFSNPNQLGLYSLLALGYAALLHYRLGTSRATFAFALLAAGALALMSLSKAAMLGTALLVAFYAALVPLRTPAAVRLRPFLLALAPVVLACMAFALWDEISLFSKVADRLASIGVSGDDNLAARGYGRILLWPQYLLLGAGEGLYGRWDQDQEIHSMFGTLIFSYGLPGVGLVFCLLAFVFRRNPRDFLMFVVPVLLYSVTHHPMRQPMFWMFLLLVAWSGLPDPRGPGFAGAARTRHLPAGDSR